MNKMKFIHILSFLVVAGVITSCTRDELTDGIHSVQGKQPLLLTANFPGTTRATVDNYWDGGETVYVQVINDYESTSTIQWDTAAVLKYKVAADKMTLEYSEGTYKPFWTFTKKPKLIRAWYSGTGTINNINNSVQWEVSSWQNSSTNYEQRDFVFAQKLATFDKAISNGVGLTFYHQVAKVVVNVRKSQNNLFSSVTSASIRAYKSGTFTPPEYDSQESKTCGTWAKIPRVYPGSIQMKKLTLPNTADFGGDTEEALVSYEALVIPIAFTSSDAGLYLLDIRVDGFNPFYYRIPSSGVNWKPGYIYTYNITITPSGLQLESFSESVGWDTTGATDSGEVVL